MTNSTGKNILKQNGRAQSSRSNGQSGLALSDQTGVRNSLPLAKKPDLETTQTYTWILSHLELDPNVSLPKQEVYDEYKAYCRMNHIEPLCVADFGKAMKHAFPCIKPRRLGQRGNSRYCYSGLRKRYILEAPKLPNLNFNRLQNSTNGSNFIDHTNQQQQQQHQQKIQKQSYQQQQQHQPQPNHQQQQQQQQNHQTQQTHTNPSRIQASWGQPCCQPTQCTNDLALCDGGRSQLKNCPQESSGGNTIMAVKYNNNTALGQTRVDACGIYDISYMNQQNQNIQFADRKQVMNQSRLPASSFNGPTSNQGTSCHLNQPNSHPLLRQMPCGPHLINPMQNSHTQVANHYESDVSTQVSMMAIQPPGTPDDDDYRHNYQHIEPTMFTNFPMTTNQMFGSSHQQNQSISQIPAVTSSEANLVSIPPRSLASANTNIQGCNLYLIEGPDFTNKTNDTDYHPNQTNLTTATTTTTSSSSTNISVPHSNYEGSSQDPVMTIPLQNNCLININSSRFDTCASPFQSPASTPYPNTAGPSS